MRTEIQTPDHRIGGKYQFVTGWTGGGAEMCVHLTAEQITERCTARYGGGRLVDDGERLWWEQDYATGDVDDDDSVRIVETEQQRRDREDHEEYVNQVNSHRSQARE